MILDRADWYRLSDLPSDTRLTVAFSGGRLAPAVVHASWGTAILARLLTGATDQQQVSYRNGDTFGIRQGNLVVSERAGRCRRSRNVPVLSGFSSPS